ncbi:MAG: phosphoadenylyl-sulfate reductase [Solirubrobacteraceae bacterium]|jgi:phosphoadenosine phosphosulfate reductase
MRGLATAAPAPDLEHESAETVLAHMLERYHPRLALACSFQKEEAVLIDMLLRLEPGARVFTIDTGALFPETYEAWRTLESHYGVRVEVFDAQEPGGMSWSAERCCSERKVAALDRALEGLGGWITGLRREQAPTRATVAKLSYDERRGLWKANPLADWSEQDVWSYIARHEVPYNALHDRGYASIGCAPCTLPGSGREGRWAGTDKTECGLHVAD